MKYRDLFRFSAGALRGHRLRTGLSLLGVAIGVASVILLTSLGEGARLYVVNEFTSLGSNLLVVISGKTETAGAAPFLNRAPHDLTVADTEALVRSLPRVRRAAPVSVGSARVNHGERSREVMVIGTTAAFVDIRHLSMASGRFLPEAADEAGRQVCVLGTRVKEELFGAENPLGSVLRVGEYRFRVTGVLARQGTTLGMNVDDVIYLPVADAMRIFNTTSLFRVILDVPSHTELEPVKRAVVDLLADRHEGVEDVTVLTQDSIISTFERILTMLTAALGGIAAISLAVAGIGIMNVMLVTVTERTREIGLLKAVGVTRRQVLSVFLVESSILSSLGGALGLALGLGLDWVGRRIQADLPLQPPWWAVAAAIAVSILVGVVFGAVPARRAAALDPIAALARR